MRERVPAIGRFVAVISGHGNHTPTRSVLAVLAAVLLVSVPSAVQAQIDTGSISGLITDQTGAALPGVTVTVTATTTGQVRTVVTNEVGRYQVSALQPSRYSIKADLQLAGAAIERLRVKGDNLTTSQLNVKAAQSRIMDADLASEQLKKSTLEILQQTATAQLAAANTAPASILALFRQ